MYWGPAPLRRAFARNDFESGYSFSTIAGVKYSVVSTRISNWLACVLV